MHHLQVFSGYSGQDSRFHSLDIGVGWQIIRCVVTFLQFSMLSLHCMGVAVRTTNLTTSVETLLAKDAFNSLSACSKRDKGSATFIF